jgi:hypothetical protein
VYYVDAARLNLGLFQTDINVLWDLAPHDVSILLYVLQQDPIAVSARGSSSITPGVEDVAYVELRFQNGLLAHLHLSWLDPCKVRRVTIVGSKKMVVCDDVHDVEKIRIYDKGVDRRYETDQFEDFHLTYRYGGVSIPPVPFEEPLRVQCQHFLECARTGARPQSDGRVGVRVVRVIEQAEHSLKNGGSRVPVALDVPLDASPTYPSEVVPDALAGSASQNGWAGAGQQADGQAEGNQPISADGAAGVAAGVLVAAGTAELSHGD